MEDHPTTLYISTLDMDLKNAKEVASFLKSCGLGKEPRLLNLTNLYKYKRNLLTRKRLWGYTRSEPPQVSYFRIFFYSLNAFRSTPQKDKIT